MHSLYTHMQSYAYINILSAHIQARDRLGNIGDTGIPRVLDLGQCNDTFSAIKIALTLADALKCKVSDLPLSIVLSWYEQKAIAVLLTCLHLGLKPIRVGPVLPAFVTKDVLDVLVKEFGVVPVSWNSFSCLTSRLLFKYCACVWMFWTCSSRSSA
jgi:hydroxylamine reductase (hybrid-cluster protein)